MEEKKDFLIGSPAITILLFGLILLLGFKLISLKSEELPGEAVPVISPQKISPGSKHPPYTTNPPSSGWYTESSLRDGIFASPLADEQIVAALAKGTVVIVYNCNYKSGLATPFIPPREENSSPSPSAEGAPELATPSAKSPRRQSPEEMTAVWRQVREQNKKCGDTVSQLRKIVESKGTSGLILSPYNKLDARIALVSWGRLRKLFWVDEQHINQFIEAHRGKRPKI